MLMNQTLTILYGQLLLTVCDLIKIGAYMIQDSYIRLVIQCGVEGGGGIDLFLSDFHRSSPLKSLRSPVANCLSFPVELYS
jgi:hypothetical protein